MSAAFVRTQDAGFSKSGGWTSSTSNAPYYSSAWYYNNSAGGTAQWQITGLTGGTAYLIAISWPGQANRPPNTQWEILDSNGSTDLLDYTTNGALNQVPYPVGAIYTGAYACMFQILGSVTPTGTSLTVKITVPSGGNYAIADAVLYQPLTDAATAGASVTGNWSNTTLGSSPWAGLFKPRTNDYVMVGSALTCDTTATIGGTGFTTGGLPVLSLNTGGSLTINSGATLTLAGDLWHIVASNVTLNSGSSLVFKPPSGQQAVWNLNSTVTNVTSLVACNGTSGSHCTVTTDTSGGALNSYMTRGTAQYNDWGLFTASYTDFSNFGTSSKYGIATITDSASNRTVSITNCTFTGCNINLQFGINTNWDGNLTFSGNQMASSVSTSQSGIAGAITVSSLIAASSGTRLFTSNYFDLSFVSVNGQGLHFQYNIFASGLICAGATTSSWTQYDSNVHCHADATSPHWCTNTVTNCYELNTDGTGNPAGITLIYTGSNVTVDGCLFDAAANSGGTGDCVFPPGFASPGYALALTRNIVLPGTGATYGYGNLLSASILASGANYDAITCEHNTVSFYGTDIGAFSFGHHIAAPQAGTIASCRANIAWSPSIVTNQFILSCDDDSGSDTLNSVTTAGYNCGYNCATSSAATTGISCNGTRYGVYGYGTFVGGSTNPWLISTAGPLPNSQIGTGDIAVNPQFVDSTRSLTTWGQKVANVNGNGTLPTWENTVAWIFSHGPSTQIPAMLTWIRAGFAVKNSALKAASYSGDTSPADANGNAWPGGAPGIGAMGYQAAAGPCIPVLIMLGQRAW